MIQRRLKKFLFRQLIYQTKKKYLHDEIVKQVDTMLQLQQLKHQTTLAEKLEQLNQRIAYTDDKINKLVYELYGLNEQDIKIVEVR